MKRLFYHPESESYLWSAPEDLGEGIDAALCEDVTGQREHEQRAWRQGVRAVICPYCFGEAELTDSAEVYDGRSYGPIWLCRPCQAWVGVHKNDDLARPLGRLADAELREWKKRAHAAFDPLWKRKMQRDNCWAKEARGAGYRWLAKSIGIPFEECHIGMFDVGLCRRVVEICSAVGQGGARQ